MHPKPELTSNDQPTAPRKVAVHTLGCKLNFTESATIARQFADLGYEIVEHPAGADILLLNTCSVTLNAERECRQIVRRALKRSPHTFIAVMGCYAQLRPEEIASIDGVDVVLGAKEKFDLTKRLRDFAKRSSPLILSDPIEEATDFHVATSQGSSSRTRGFLKVQDGCDYNCSFCTIPEARGVSRSGDVEQIVEQAIGLSESGFLEIVLSGVNVGDFGRKDGSSFLELLKALDREPRVTARIRISSIEPNLLNDEIIELAARSPKICHHFHIPLQSGSDKILKLMQRRYKPELYRSRIERIRSIMPDACIGADVIVGFPDETDGDFEDTCAFIRDLDISYLHVFTYSERPGTKASKMKGVVPPSIRSERNERLRILSEKKLRAFYESQIGSSGDVILEQRDVSIEGNSYRTGHTANYVKVRLGFVVDEDATSVRVRLESNDGEYLVAEPLEVLTRRSAELFELPILQAE